MTERRPRRITGLTALPASTGGTLARAYPLTELDESHDDVLSCSLCAGVVEPGEPMTYRADSAGGFQFFHPDCALAPEALAGAS
jgi:hypothetical protein